MKKLVVLAAVCAGVMLFATPESARADHYGRRSDGYGFSPVYGGHGGHGGYGGFGGIRGSRYGFGPDYCPHHSRGFYGGRYIDPYHGVRLRNRAYNRYDFILRAGNHGFYYGR